MAILFEYWWYKIDFWFYWTMIKPWDWVRWKAYVLSWRWINRIPWISWKKRSKHPATSWLLWKVFNLTKHDDFWGQDIIVKIDPTKVMPVSIWIVKLVMQARQCSRNEASRLIKQGSVLLDYDCDLKTGKLSWAKITDPTKSVELMFGSVLWVGKDRPFRVRYGFIDFMRWGYWYP